MTRACAIFVENRPDVASVCEAGFLRTILPQFRSDNGPEFVTGTFRQWIAAIGARTAFIEPESPWENGCIESFKARLRDELLNRELFYTLKEAQVLVESWRRHYNAVRRHSSLGFPTAAWFTALVNDRNRARSLSERQATIAVRWC